MSRPEYFSIFADSFNAYLDHKESLGYGIDDIKYTIKQFDRLICDLNITDQVIDDRILTEWCKQKPNETTSNQYTRVNVIKHLLTFMVLGGVDVKTLRNVRYIPTDFIPHIYSDDETGRYLYVLDSLRGKKDNCYSLHLPVITRILIGCGTRITETLQIRFNDINLDNGIITLRETKGKKERIIVPHDSLSAIIQDHIEALKPSMKRSGLLFQNDNGNCLVRDTVHKKHVETLLDAGIPYIGERKGPRIHDWRHTFAVKAFKQMVDDGADMYVALPILSAYLGHKTIYATEKYVRLSMIHFPYLREKVDALALNFYEEVFNDWND